MPCTWGLWEAKPGNLHPTLSPTSGRVVAFAVKAAGPATVTFRLLRLGPAYPKFIIVAGAGTGPTVELPGPGVYEFPVDLPIRAYDFIGLDSSTSFPVGDVRAETFGFYGPVEEGGYSQPLGSPPGELLVNAVVEPSAALAFEGAVLNRRGKATLGVKAPGPGELTIEGAGIRRIERHLPYAGRHSLRLGIAAAVRREVVNHGSARLELSARFAPEGGAVGAQAATVKLRRAKRG